MMKLKALPFILMGTAMHIVCGYAVVSAQLDCGIQPHCVPPITEPFAYPSDA